MEKYTGMFVHRGIHHMLNLRALQNSEKDDHYQVSTNMVEDQALNDLDAAIIALHFHEEYLDDMQSQHVD